MCEQSYAYSGIFGERTANFFYDIVSFLFLFFLSCLTVSITSKHVEYENVMWVPVPGVPVSEPKGSGIMQVCKYGRTQGKYLID